MLALTRKKNESVVIGDNIRIVVVDVRGDKVRLGIEAPNDVAVFRSEVWVKMQQQRERDANLAKIRETQASDFAETADFATKTLARVAEYVPNVAARDDEKDGFALEISKKNVKIYRRGKIVERSVAASKKSRRNGQEKEKTLDERTN